MSNRLPGFSVRKYEVCNTLEKEKVLIRTYSESGNRTRVCQEQECRLPGNEYNGLANKKRIHVKLHALTNETLSAAVVSKPRRKSDAEQRQWCCREKRGADP